MTIDYTIGLEAALQFALIPSLLLVVLILLGIIKYRNEIPALKLVVLAILGCIISPPVITICIVPIIYVPLNFFEQAIFSLEFYRQEISTGVVSLRIVTLLLGYNAIANFLGLIRSNKVLSKHRRKKGLNIDDSHNSIINVSKKDKELWRQFDSSMIIFSQFLYYLVCIFYLWLFIYKDVSNINTTFAHWCLFFICDDWVIISDYMLKSKSSMLGKHFIRIVIFNVLLFSSIVIVAGTYLNWIITAVIFLKLGFLLTIFHMYQWRLRKFENELLGKA